MSTCPVGYTCPAIDDAIADLESAYKTIDNLYDNFNRFGLIKDEYMVELSEVLCLIENLLGRRGTLEELRSSNDALRKWGTDLEAQIQELDAEIELLQQENENLKEELQNV